MVWWLAQAGIQAIGGRVAAGAAEQAGERQRQLIEQETQEQIRRTEREFEFTLGMQQAVLGASGVDVTTGSALAFRLDQEAEARRQLDWLERSGKLREQAAEAAARSAAKAAEFGGYSGAFGSIAGGLGGQ